jgi:hypothetical protein
MHGFVPVFGQVEGGAGRARPQTKNILEKG